MRVRSIDLNADLGEGYNGDETLMPLISSCNIACGGHAGDASTIRAAIDAARRHSVAIGGHPSYPDRENFGRRSISLSFTELGSSLGDQLSLLRRIAEEQGVGISHVKPHGALYHDLSLDEFLAHLFLSTTKKVLPDARITALAGSAFAQLAAQNGFGVIAEGFADRRYAPDGDLLPRTDNNALIDDPMEQAEQALSMALGQPLTSACGTALQVQAETICVHGDSAHAVLGAQAIKKALDAEGITIAAP